MKKNNTLIILTFLSLLIVGCSNASSSSTSSASTTSSSSSTSSASTTSSSSSTSVSKIPSIDFTNVVATTSSILFELNIDDPNELGAVTKLALYKNNTLVENLSDLTVRQFTGLISNTSYELRSEYTYNIVNTNTTEILTKSFAKTTLSFVSITSITQINLSGLGFFTPDFQLGGQIELASNSIFVFGSILDRNTGKQDALLIKLDWEGELIWIKTYGGFERDEFSQGILSQQQTLILGGYSSSGNGDFPLLISNIQNPQPFFVEINLEGTVLKHKQIKNNSNWDNIRTLVSDEFGNFYVLTRFSIAKYSNEFVVVWENQIVEMQSERGEPRSILLNDFLYIGYNEQSLDISILKISLVYGQLSCKKYFGGSKIDSIRGLKSNNNGELIIIGSTQSYDSIFSSNLTGDRVHFIFAISQEGNLINANTILGTGTYVESAIEVVLLDNGKYFLIARERNDYLVGYLLNNDFAFLQKINIDILGIYASSTDYALGKMIFVESWESFNLIKLRIN